MIQHIFDEATLRRFEMEESIKSVCMGAQNILLTCSELGLGAVPMSGPGYTGANQFKSLLQMPDEDEVVLVIAIGKPTKPVPNVSRKALDEVVTWME